MCCLDIVRMVVSPRSSHPFRIPVVWNNIVVVGEFFLADRTDPVLFNNLPVQEFPHFGAGPEFPVSSWVVRILDVLQAHPYCGCLPFLPDRLPATAE
jgi:hypothetical protein